MLVSNQSVINQSFVYNKIHTMISPTVRSAHYLSTSSIHPSRWSFTVS